MINRLTVAGLILIVPTIAFGQDWWQGIWTAETEWCAVADQVGSVTPAPIAITATEVLGYENSCGITGAVPLDGAGAVHLRLECQSEGSTYEEDRVIMRTDDTAQSVWIWFGSDDPVLFQRCN